MSQQLDRIAVIAAARSRLGIKYGFGYKWSNDNIDPRSPIDCSGLVVWCYARGGVVIPQGSQAQYDLCERAAGPLPGDLGFFKHPDGAIHHVGILDGNSVLEARGEPFNEVIDRPRQKWEDWSGFSGWMRLRDLEP